MQDDDEPIPDMDKLNWDTIEVEIRKTIMQLMSPFMHHSKCLLQINAMFAFVNAPVRMWRNND